MQRMGVLLLALYLSFHLHKQNIEVGVDVDVNVNITCEQGLTPSKHHNAINTNHHVY